MNPELDPNKSHEVVGNNSVPAKTNNALVQTGPVETKPEKPKTLPAFLDTLVNPDTIRGDLCRYFIFPAIEQALHKTLSALLGHYILGQNIKPSNNKGNNVYIYNDGNRDYSAYSRTQASVVDANRVSSTVTNKEYRGNTQSTFYLQHYADDDYNHVNPIPWTWGDVEQLNEHLNDRLSFALEQSAWASVQDVFDAAGLSGASPTSNKWGWRSIAKMSVQLKEGDDTTIVICMGSDPKPIT